MIGYRIDVLQALKEKGYNQTALRAKKLLGQSCIESLRIGCPISMRSLSKISDLLECEPGDIIGRVTENGF